MTDAAAPPFAWVVDTCGAATRAEPLPPLPSLRMVSFADSLRIPSTASIGVRATAEVRNGQLQVDLRDSDDAEPTHGFGLSEADTHTACATALATALGGEPLDSRWRSRVRLHLGQHSWVGAGQPSDPGRRAMGMARVYDALLGALAIGWPQRVGAGSNSLGALVELRVAGSPDRVRDVVAGAEGGQPHRRGRSGWNCPLFPPAGTHPLPRWVDILQRGRERSGGGGARPGGEGVERRYRLRRPAQACVGIDRVDNPPHGVHRAGPPCPAEVSLCVPGEPAAPVPAWRVIDVPAGATLVVRTAGGAGHGFGGYGEIEFDASEWFGAPPSADGH